MSRIINVALAAVLILVILATTVTLAAGPTASVTGDHIIFAGRGSVTFSASYPVCGKGVLEIVKMKGTYPITAFYYPTAMYCLDKVCLRGDEWL